MDEASTSANSRPKRKGGSGRKKIEMKKIENQRRRWVTFSKRKKSLLEKAAKLSRKTGEEIGVIIISEKGRVYTSENADAVIQRYLSIKDDQHDDDDENEHENLVNEDGVLQNKPVDIEKINDGKLSLEEVKELGEVSVDMRDNVVARMEEIKGDNCLIDLNKTPDDEQFS